jgi:hypothetical protein
MLLDLVTSWLLPSREPSRIDAYHVGGVLTSEDLDIMASRPRPVMGRLCRHGHRIVGRNAYRRKNGKLECRTCRASASRRYRARLLQD